MLRFLALLTGLTVAEPALAIEFFTCGDAAPAGECHPLIEPFSAPFGACGSGAAFVIEFACRVVMLVLSIIGGLCIITIIFGATEIQMFGLNEEKKEGGKKMIYYALGGLALSVMFGVIMKFIVVLAQGFVGIA